MGVRPYNRVTYTRHTAGINRKNSLKIHERLTKEHFNLGYASRMRNHFAEDILSKKNALFITGIKTISTTILTFNSVHLSTSVLGLHV